MRLLGRKHLQKIRGLNALTDRWLAAWASEVVNASWKASIDVVKQYQAVTQVDECTFLFKVGNFDGFVELNVAFPQGIALITTIQKSL